jgi:transcription initiation factor TFIIIB Brf1 subunit/transcription initiation factor TFIIB
MEDKHSRSIKMLCSTCGGSDFEFDPEVENGPARCVSCDRIYSREELTRENQARIDENVEEIKAEVVEDLHKSIRDMFKGSKHIKFK